MEYLACYVLGLVTLPALAALLFWGTKDADMPVDRYPIRGPFHQ